MFRFPVPAVTSNKTHAIQLSLQITTARDQNNQNEALAGAIPPDRRQRSENVKAQSFCLSTLLPLLLLIPRECRPLVIVAPAALWV